MRPPRHSRPAVAALLAAGLGAQTVPGPARLEPVLRLELAAVERSQEDPASRTVRRVGPPLPPVPCAFSADGRWLAAVRNDSRLVLCDLREGTERTVDLDPTQPVRAVLPCPGSVEVALADATGIRFWSPSLGQPVRSLDLPLAARPANLGAALSHDGRTLWTGFGRIDLLRPGMPMQLVQRGNVAGLFAPRGDLMVLRDGLMVTRLGGPVGKVALQVFATRGKGHQAHVEISAPGLTDLAWMPDGRTLLFCRGEALETWRAPAFELVRAYTVEAWFARPLDERTAAVAWMASTADGDRGYLGLWDLEQGICLHRRPCGNLTGIEVAADGGHVAAIAGSVVEVFRVRR